MSNPIQQIRELNKRLAKAEEIVAQDKVHKILGKEGHYAVQNSEGTGFYLVNGECSCQDAQNRKELHKGWCKHKLAIELYKEAEEAVKAEAPKPQSTCTNCGKEADRHCHFCDIAICIVCGHEHWQMHTMGNHWTPGAKSPIESTSKSLNEEVEELF